jgi:hypothetical protein
VPSVPARFSHVKQHLLIPTAAHPVLVCLLVSADPASVSSVDQGFAPAGPDFVRSLAHRIASFPAAGQAVVKDRVNAIALAPVEDFRRDSDLFAEGVRSPEVQRQIGAALKHGLQTRDAEMALARLLGDLTAG